MRIDKVILRAALSTVAAIFGLVVFAVCALAIVYPSTMMEITYDLGMDKLCIANAKQAYKRSGQIYYAAFAMDVALSMDDDEYIQDCGERFAADDEFVAYCMDKDAKMNLAGTDSYRQYVYGQVCLAVYRQGEKTQAVDKALAWLDDGAFPKNNALVAVLVTSAMENDGQTMAYAAEKMLSIQAEIVQADQAYFAETLQFAQGE